MNVFFFLDLLLTFIRIICRKTYILNCIFKHFYLSVKLSTISIHFFNVTISINMGRIRGFKMSSTVEKGRNPCQILWQTWDIFWHRTSISGVSNAGIARSGFRRVCWMVLFTFFTVLTAIGFYNVVYDFAQYPVTTSVTVKYQNQVNPNFVFLKDAGNKLDLKLITSLFNEILVKFCR